MTRGCGADYENQIVWDRHPRVRHDCRRSTSAKERRRPVITEPGMKHEAVAPVRSCCRLWGGLRADSPDTIDSWLFARRSPYTAQGALELLAELWGRVRGD